MIVLGCPRELQSFMGLFNFLALSVNVGRLHMRRFHHWLASRWDHTLPSIDLFLSVTLICWIAIGVWSDTEWILRGVPLLSPQPVLYLFADSSMEGWGAFLGGTDVKDI